MKTTISSLLICLCALTLHAQTYELVVLDNTTNESGAYGINSYGYVSGYKLVNGQSTPYLWSPNKGFFALSKPSGAVSSTGIAYSINDYFEIAGTFGFFNNGGNLYHMGRGTAVTWVFDSGVDNFVPYTIAQSPAMVRDINNNAEVAGQEGDFGFTRDVYSGEGYNAFMNNSYCFGINDHGNATGMFISDASSTTFSPMYIRKESNGTYTMISGASKFGGTSWGTKINTNNQVVGACSSGGFYWEPETGSNTIFGSGTYCFGINSTKLIVGTTNTHACMWQPKQDGSFAALDLNTLTEKTNIVLETAFGVNNQGQIVGQCLDTTTGVKSAYMLTPKKNVPKALTVGTNGLVLRWIATTDHNYAIHTSTDMKTWASLPDIYTADGTNAWVTIIPNQNKMFFMVSDLTP